MTPTPDDTGRVETGQLPVRRLGDQWVLLGRTGHLPVTDPGTARELDALTAALAAADRAIAAKQNSKSRRSAR
ncbi:hypothetical protein [Streptacidiphilus fuscans]|uniref:Uncharacterized protein n=1 Tax=Streptacidiphilus fuscans TaxID=2789292 RepID=A0A931FGZ7_9ACTN|nr:hypothetical protein [Streptacidiphilus fuscans]MBF9071795.1 hypothetical protein [Streptacidiphilus fuscans]